MKVERQKQKAHQSEPREAEVGQKERLDQVRQAWDLQKHPCLSGESHSQQQGSARCVGARSRVGGGFLGGSKGVARQI